MNKELLIRKYTVYRLFIFPFAVILSCLVLIMFVIFPQASNLMKNTHTEGELRSKFTNLEAKAQSLENIDEGDLKSKLSLALNIFPSDYDFSSVVGVLQDLAGRSGFTIEALQLNNPSSQKTKTSTSEFNVRVELTGSKTLLDNLVNSIEDSPRIMKVTSMEVSNASVGDYVNLILSIGVYYQALPNTFGGVDSPLPVLSDKEEAVLATLARFPVANLTGAISVPKGKSNPFE